MASPRSTPRAAGVRRKPTRCSHRRTELAQAMKIDLTDTTASKINKALVQGRRAIGTPAVGMVLTMVIVTDEENAYDSIKAAEEASREHPSRTLVVIKRHARTPRDRTNSRLDAEVRVGADSGAGETVVLQDLRRGVRPRRLRGPAAAATGRARRRLVACGRPRCPPRTRWAPSRSAGSPTCTPSRRRLTALEARVDSYRAGRHRPGVDPADALGVDAGRRARPGWSAEGDLGRRRERGRQPQRRAARPLAGRPARRAGRAGRHRRSGGDRGAARHEGRRDRDRPARGTAGHAVAARAALPHPRAEGAQHFRADRRGAAPPRRGRDVRRRPAGRERRGDPPVISDSPRLTRRPEWVALEDHRADALLHPRLRELFAADPAARSAMSCGSAICGSTTPST